MLGCGLNAVILPRNNHVKNSVELLPFIYTDLHHPRRVLMLNSVELLAVLHLGFRG